MSFPKKKSFCQKAIQSFILFSLLLIGVFTSSSYLLANTNSHDYCESLSNVSITRNSAETFYINDDISPEKRGQYVLYSIENIGTGSIDAYVTIDQFTGNIRLGDQAADGYAIGNLAPGEVGHAYFFVVIDLSISGQNGHVSGSNTHNISVYNGEPDAGGTIEHSTTFDIALIEDVIKASANKVMGLSINGQPELGSTFSITVTGETGTIGAERVVNFTAATNLEWPANALKLTHAIVNFSKVGNGKNDNDGLSFENELNFQVLDTKNTAYEITYTFELIQNTGSVTDYEPTVYISSGTQFKHSVLDSGVEVPAIPSSGATLSGFVWSDDDFDGIKQSGESKMNGVKVRLLDTLDNELESTTSSGVDGNFSFIGIATGQYHIRFDRNDRFVATMQDATSDDSIDSDMNRATRIVALSVISGTNIDHITAGFTPDFDRDLIPDVVEQAGSTSYDEVDPAGYFYDEISGEIIAGGMIHVRGPGSINIVDDASATGYYSWLIDGTPGVYTMSIVPPANYTVSSTRGALSTIDPTGLTPDPFSVGSPDSNADGFLDNFSAGANPFYLSFELAAGDPFLINNNIPLSAIALPVEISRFASKTNNCLVDLTWTTESEVNFSHFEIQRSKDGRHFQTIDYQVSNGTSPTRPSNNYSYTDAPLMNTNYYRLNMVDLDGTSSFSEIIVHQTTCVPKPQPMTIYPNPIGLHEVLTISLPSSQSKAIFLQVLNQQGQTIQEKHTLLNPGLNQLSLDLSDHPSGVYSLRLIEELGQSQNHQFIIHTE